MATANLQGEVEFFAIAMYLFNESNGGSFQLRNDSTHYRMTKYSMDGEVFHAVGQYDVDGDYCKQPPRFQFSCEHMLEPNHITAALELLEPTLSAVIQNHAGNTYEVIITRELFNSILRQFIFVVQSPVSC